jgi:hypothetical protein
MKRTSFILAGAIGLFILALALPALAENKGKEITITGNAKCGKCALKETDKCQNVIQVEKDGKKTTYYLVENDVSKEFHGNVCKETKRATATGTNKKVDGKNQFTATKIELAK